jgi:crossover junction endodeoxyribonuclease RuvC
MQQAVRILGIDPGSQITGFGVIEASLNRTRLVARGVVRTVGGDHTRRLEQIFRGLGEIVIEHRPEEIAIERVFMHRNADSALKLGQARSAALCATFDANVPVYEYAARQVKQSVVGRGGADKTQIQHMVRVLLNIKDELQPDSADALAVALCHAFQRRTRSLVDQAVGQK